jgi:hypothetical protein
VCGDVVETPGTPDESDAARRACMVSEAEATPLPWNFLAGRCDY